MEPAFSLPLPSSPDAAPSDGFEAMLALALSEAAEGDPALEPGPADFGLWGTLPDGQGRLDLDEVAAQLQASLPPLCRNLGNACRLGGVALDPPLRLSAPAGRIDCGQDARGPLVQTLLTRRTALQRQIVRLLAGYALVRGAATLTAHQRALARLGPARLAQAVASHPEFHLTPPLALSCRQDHIAIEEARGLSWRQLCLADALAQELIGLGLERPAAVPVAGLPVSEAFDPLRSRLDQARRSQR
ncbi:hypothetical protein [Chitinimonas lacunae]|uniref:DUF222 domain-containing protein n=1 Tax=Chitinimonas lacunae TaxID=1963018 RepID=A0ABV8MNA6_9NEIS